VADICDKVISHGFSLYHFIDVAQAEEDQVVLAHCIDEPRHPDVKGSICGFTKNDCLLYRRRARERFVYQIDAERVADDLNNVLSDLMLAKPIGRRLIFEQDLSRAIQDQNRFLNQVEVSKSLLNVHHKMLFDFNDKAGLSICI